MNREFIPEKQLQNWFVDAANNNRLGDAIQNREALKERLLELQSTARTTDAVSRDGIARALRICELLDEADKLSADRSVALPGYNQMRPDLVLFTSSAHYLLVELKTQPGPERQGVQELLAYSSAMKMAMPYVSDFIYIIVANSWEPLLSFSVRALILEGKRVLPLKWNLLPNGEFALDAKLDLFEFDFVQPYAPFYAMTTSTFAVTHPNRARFEASKYFRWVARGVFAECRRLQQAGFAIIWANPANQNDQITSLTLATVNQHWQHGEHVPSDFNPGPIASPSGIGRVVHKSAKQAYIKVAGKADAADFWTQSAASEAAAQLYPQSSLSYELLDGSRLRPFERDFEEKYCSNEGFSLGGDCSLSIYLKWQLTYHWGVQVQAFLPFGELKDFIRLRQFSKPVDAQEVASLLEQFSAYKDYPHSVRHGYYDDAPVR
ncbi:hypothetical protein [Duganella sp. Dugasp56]|uniref:hypothetical protein n=1 Tax=Duganella sp. Dugasp56 TaxID=3243046 RepID=UPI0039AF4047